MALISDDIKAVSAMITEDFSTLSLFSHDFKGKTLVPEDTTAIPMISDDVKAAAMALSCEDTTKAPPILIPYHKKRSRFLKLDRVPCQIEQGLYLGSVVAAGNKEVLKEFNITHVLTVRGTTSRPYPNDFTYKNIKLADNVKSDLAQHFDECFNFIDEAKSMGGGVLVHCYAGASRSATIVIAYLMKRHAMSLREAFGQVKAKRRIVRPNPGFKLQLQNFAKSLRVAAKEDKREDGESQEMIMD